MRRSGSLLQSQANIREVPAIYWSKSDNWQDGHTIGQAGTSGEWLRAPSFNMTAVATALPLTMPSTPSPACVQSAGCMNCVSVRVSTPQIHWHGKSPIFAIDFHPRNREGTHAHAFTLMRTRCTFRHARVPVHVLLSTYLYPVALSNFRGENHHSEVGGDCWSRARWRGRSALVDFARWSWRSLRCKGRAVSRHLYSGPRWEMSCAGDPHKLLSVNICAGQHFTMKLCLFAL
jgi:hypothetical protein